MLLVSEHGYCEIGRRLGEPDPVVLELDHIGEKSYNVSYLVSRAVSLE